MRSAACAQLAGAAPDMLGRCSGPLHRRRLAGSLQSERLMCPSLREEVQGELCTALKVFLGCAEVDRLLAKKIARAFPDGGAGWLPGRRSSDSWTFPRGSLDAA